MEHRELPVDPDAPEPAGDGPVLLAVGLGGALGSVARWGVSAAFPGSGFPWATLLVNLSGALLLGILMVVVADVLTTSHLVRPFLGVGVLGGYTTFSTYALETRDLLAAGDYAAASAYSLGSVVAGLLAAGLGIAATRRLLDAGAHR
jgi:CrcB protein